MTPTTHPISRQCRRAALAGAFALAGALAAAQGLPPSTLPPKDAPPAQGDPAADAAAAEGQLIDTDKLLANPVLGKPEFRQLYGRRRDLVISPMAPADFERTAKDLAAKGAHFSAIEILWFAEKLPVDQAKRDAYQAQMKKWIAEAGAANKIVDEGEQLFAGGRIKEALARYKAALDANPFCERAHYAAANANFLIYMKENGAKETLPPLQERARLFRLIYDRLACAIAIDPILYDAYYLLSSARETLSDDPGFLEASQPFTNRASAFRAQVVPVMDQVENGDRDPRVLHELGKGFEEVGVLDYAVFAYKLALERGSKNPETAQRMNELVEKLRGPKKQAP